MRPGHLALERQDEGSADPSKANLPREEEVIRDEALFVTLAKQRSILENRKERKDKCSFFSRFFVNFRSLFTSRRESCWRF